MGVLIALFALAQVFLALPAGQYCERHGLKKPIMWSAVAAAVTGSATLSNVLGPVLAGFMIDGAGFRAAARASAWRLV